MSVVFFLLFIMAIPGIIYPKMFKGIFRRVLKRWIFAVSALVFLISLVIATPPAEDPTYTSLTDKNAAPTETIDKNNDTSENEAKTKNIDEKNAKAEKESAIAARKAKEEKEEKEAALQAAKNPKWDMKEVNAAKNGNVELAIKMLKVIGNDNAAPETIKAGSVFKAPWSYYGKPIKFSANVTIVEDYPPESKNGKMGINSQVVARSDDGTILDVVSTSGSGNIEVGDDITFIAYAVGKFTVENKLGGRTDQLALVSNKY